MHMERSYKQSPICTCCHKAVTKQEKQYSIRSPKSTDRQVPVAIPPGINQLRGRNVGSSLHRYICICHNSSHKILQYSVYHSSPSGVNALAHQDCTFHNIFVNEPVCLKLGYWTYTFRRQTQPQSH